VEISVITTTYNGLPFLTQAIRSVLDQTLADFEYIIVDDGSTDSTSEAVAGIRDRRVRYVQCGRIGRAAALNRALQEARGRYVANLDADDWMLPERLAEQRAFLELNPDVGMVGSACYAQGPDGSKIVVEFPVVDADLRRRLWVGYPFVHSAVTYRREPLIAAGGFDESLPCSIDYDACTRLALHAHLANLPIPLVVRRVHGRNFFMKHISTRQYISAISRIKWRYWRDSGRPLRALPLLISSTILGGLRKWTQH
jgi:glycosyltransferase involved in cell wall biosynthesis